VTRTVDLVITGAGGAALAAAAEALRRGQRVLVVLRAGQMERRLWRRLRAATHADANRMTVMLNAEVVCVDGVGGVEAVVIRHVLTGRLCGVNASSFAALS
jgi:shikimate 5-dehydrogenase